MGLHIELYKHFKWDCTNGGVSSKAEGLCITNIDEILGEQCYRCPFEPSDRYPAAKLVEHVGHAIIQPEGLDHKWLMFGGNYGSTSDSRFSQAIEKLIGHRFYGAVPIHDRWETAEQQRLTSNT